MVVTEGTYTAYMHAADLYIIRLLLCGYEVIMSNLLGNLWGNNYL